MSSAHDPSGATARHAALVALGANLGDRMATLRAAVRALEARADMVVTAKSQVYETDPVGPPDQPRYLNAAVAIETWLAPEPLLAALLEVERSLGRARGSDRWQARTIDLDLILHGECVRAGGDTPGGLILPHPRFRERAFVLVPLAEIAPSARDPVTGETVESLLRACPGRSDAVRVGPLAEP